MTDEYNVAVVGATGLVGQMMVRTLEKYSLPIKTLKLFASGKSIGKKVKFKDQDLVVEELNKDSFNNVDIALFAVASDISKIYAPIACEAGCTVIDNSSHFRMEQKVPLVVPEVNSECLQNHSGIIANPNCSTIQLVVALSNIEKEYKINRIIVSTYQAVSGAGKAALDELKAEVENNISPQVLPVKTNVNHYKIAYNVIPQIDEFTDNDYTKEEMKMVNETRKIFKNNGIDIIPTCVRVPVKVGHAESVYVETEKPVDIIKLKNIVKSTKGVILLDNPQIQLYPLPRDIEGSVFVYVGRIRKDLASDYGLQMWVVADNLLKGAAYNAIQIMEVLINKNWVKGNR